MLGLTRQIGSPLNEILATERAKPIGMIALRRQGVVKLNDQDDPKAKNSSFETPLVAGFAVAGLKLV